MVVLVAVVVDLRSRRTQALVLALRASTDRAGVQVCSLGCLMCAQETRGQRSSAVCAQCGEAKRSRVNMLSCSL